MLRPAPVPQGRASYTSLDIPRNIVSRKPLGMAPQVGSRKMQQNKRHGKTKARHWLCQVPTIAIRASTDNMPVLSGQRPGPTVQMLGRGSAGAPRGLKEDRFPAG